VLKPSLTVILEVNTFPTSQGWRFSVENWWRYDWDGADFFFLNRVPQATASLPLWEEGGHSIFQQPHEVGLLCVLRWGSSWDPKFGI
jgi:hypothetical protein